MSNPVEKQMENLSPLEKEHLARYAYAAKQMQTGVEFTMGPGTTPKHLRVGVNSAMSEHAGLAWLLIKKGLISREEYLRSIADRMEEEAERLRQEIEARNPGSKVSLSGL